MKKVVILFPLIFVSYFSHAQSLSPNVSANVTAIEVIQVISNTVILQWKSEASNANFSVYYSNKAIKDVFSLYDSELAVSSNLTGVSAGRQYEYTFTISFRKSGPYYFAVVPQESVNFDNIARSVVNQVFTQERLALIPEINTTVQPVYIKISGVSNFSQIIQQAYQPKVPVITYLNLKSQEDIFQLAWSVYPKDLSEYVFVIYRSRYPIIQHQTPVGLPEYARVTNQFSFEDRNVSFEVPYYYAVVVQDSTQWDSDINVLTKPAIFLKKSPPIRKKPVVEYIKRREPLAVNKSGNLSEEEIRCAVRATLSNLRVEVDPVNKIVPELDILAQNAPEIVHTQNNPTIAMLTRNDSQTKLQNTDPKNRFSSQEFDNQFKKIKQEYIQKDYKEFNEVMGKIEELSKMINEFKALETRIAVSDQISLESLKRQLNEYYQKKDQIHIAQYRIQGLIRNLDTNRKSREQELLSELLKIQHQKVETHIASIKKEIAQQEYIKSQAIAKIAAQNIYLQTQGVNTFNIDLTNNTQNTQLFKQNYEIIKKERFQEQQILAKINSLQQELSKLETEYKTEFIQLSEISNHLENVQSYYNDVVVEKIPDINDIKHENWLVAKETWTQKNKSAWIAKNNLWQRRVEEILGSDYRTIAAKWMTPSYTLAINEAQKAFSQQNYKEALYLLSFVAHDPNALMALGQSFYYMGAYRDAFTVFITAVNMGIPESRRWLDITAAQILERKL